MLIRYFIFWDRETIRREKNCGPKSWRERNFLLALLCSILIGQRIIFVPDRDAYVVHF